MKAYERLLSYVRVFTPSDENSDTSPSSTCQFDLARMLVRELQELGVADASVDEHCYVYGHIPLLPRILFPIRSLGLSHIWTRFQISVIMK